ncbi:MAG: type III pantothenate kinase [Oceanicoccus sp.]
MILECDVGNTRCKWRIVDEGLVQSRGAFACSDGFDELTTLLDIDRVKVSSVAVASVNEKLTAVLAGIGLEVEFASASQRAAGVENSYADAGRLGVDRWLAMIAAYNRCHGPVLVLDAGSALTADLVMANGKHAGGYIVPGMRLMKSSLLAETGGVRFGLHNNDYGVEFGVDTASAVYAGVVAAEVGAAIVAIEQAGRKIPEGFAILLTGGDADAIWKNLPSSMLPNVTIVPELVLDGLRWVLP